MLSGEKVSDDIYCTRRSAIENKCRELSGTGFPLSRIVENRRRIVETADRYFIMVRGNAVKHVSIDKFLQMLVFFQ